MVWSKKKKLTPNEVALLLLNFAGDFVTDAVRDMEIHRGVQQRSGSERAADELMFFCLFAIDYAISNHVTAQQESQAIREALYYHWRQMLGDDDDGQTMWEASQQRLHEYAQIVNEEQTDEANKLVGLGTKLAECSGYPGHPRLVVLAPYLFRAATDAVGDVLQEGK
jgi:hypothetical protein